MGNISNPKSQEKKNKKTVYKETGNNETASPGETSSVTDFDRSVLTKKPKRKNKPLGAGHEPGTTPGTE